MARYSTLFLRRSTMIPRNRTAKTAHTIRTVELSIALSPFLTIVISASLDRIFSRYYIFVIIGISSRTIFIATGPTVTTNSDGKIQKKMGKISLTPSFAAFSSAIWRA